MGRLRTLRHEIVHIPDQKSGQGWWWGGCVLIWWIDGVRVGWVAVVWGWGGSGIGWMVVGWVGFGGLVVG